MLCIDLVGRYREKETDVLALWITGGVIVLGVIALFSVEVV